MSDPVPKSVHDLRRRWKPVKERLQTSLKDHPTTIRFHRACSWLQRLEQIEAGEDSDLVLTGQWIAFNALYGKWDEQKSEPRGDRECWREFVDRIVTLDADGHITSVLTEHKKLVMAILDDAYLGKYFWDDPSTQKALHTTRDRRQAATWYIEKRWSLILENLLDRIYFLRCQLIHGAATYGSRLNRDSLRRCTIMLNHFLPAVLLVLIDHGADEDWGPMCYPPVS